MQRAAHGAGAQSAQGHCRPIKRHLKPGAMVHGSARSLCVKRQADERREWGGSAHHGVSHSLATGWEVTVQLVGPNWGQERKHQSATVLRRNAARRLVQEQWAQLASLRGCSGAELRLALRSQNLGGSADPRARAGHAELVALTERSMPWADSGGTAEMDSVTCTGCEGSWVAADVRAFVSAASGVVQRRLQSVYALDAVMTEQATFDALGVSPGSLLQIVVASEVPVSVPASVNRPQSVNQQRAQDEKKKHVATVRALFNEGASRQQQQEWRLAANSYSQAIIASRAGDPSLQSLLSNRGLCRARLGEWRSAYLDHNRALNQAPSMHGRTLHYLNRGLCALRLGMLEEAHDDFESAFLHGSGSVTSSASKQMQKLKPILDQACEAQFEWLRQYYPSILLSDHCKSVEAFRALCSDVRDRLGREYGAGSGKPLSERHDRCHLVHTEALSTIFHHMDSGDPTPVADGARAEFERILKESTKQMLDEIKCGEIEQQEARATATGPGRTAGDRKGSAAGTAAAFANSGSALPPRVMSPGRETLHETEQRLAQENTVKSKEQRANMVGNVAQGFVLVRDTYEMMRINHRSRSSRQQEAASTAGKTVRPATAAVIRSEAPTMTSSMVDVVDWSRPMWSTGHGWLDMKERQREVWNRCWFKVEGDELQWYDAEHSDGGKRLGAIGLAECSNIGPSTAVTAEAGEIQIDIQMIDSTHHASQYHLQCGTDAKAKEWIEALNAAKDGRELRMVMAVPSSSRSTSEWQQHLRQQRRASASPSRSSAEVEVDLQGGFTTVFAMMEDKKLRSADLFNSLDRDSGGTVDASELRDAFAQHGVELKEPEAKALLAALDQDGDGKVDKKEFIEEMRAMKSALRRCDPIRSGTPVVQQQQHQRSQSAMANFSAVRGEGSLETTFRQLLPMSISQPFERPSTAASDNIIAQRRSIAKLSAAGNATKPPVAKVMVGGVTMESQAVVKAREQRMKRARRETERRLARTSGMRGGDGVNTPSTSQLYDDRSYKAKVRGAGQLCVGRAERVSQMALSADTVSMNDLLGDWTKAKAVSHFLQEKRPASAGSTGSADAGADARPTGAKWSAWQAELSWQRYAEDPSQGNGLGMQGHKAPMIGERRAPKVCGLLSRPERQAVGLGVAVSTRMQHVDVDRMPLLALESLLLESEQSTLFGDYIRTGDLECTVPSA